MVDKTYAPLTYRDKGGDRLNVKSGGEIRILEGGEIQDFQSEGSSVAALLFHHDIVVPHSSVGSTVELVIKHRMQIIDVAALKTGGSASDSTAAVTVQLKTSTDGDITDAMDIKVADTIITRATELDDSLYVIAAGGTIKATKVGVEGASSANNNHAAVVRITGVKRST